MAYNVLTMRYPQSCMGPNTRRWVSGIDPAAVELSAAGAEIVRKQKTSVESADRAIDSLKSLDRQIALLLTKRQCACMDVISQSKAAVKVFSKGYNEAIGVYKEYLNTGFAGEKVKKAVAWVRKLLFDDSQEVYREIVCAEVKMSESEMYLNFMFEHVPSARSFSIGIPVRPPEGGKHPFRGWIVDDELEFRPFRQRGDSLCTDIAGIDLVQPYNNGSCDTVAYHYDLRVFKKQLDDYVQNGFRALTDEKDVYYEYIGHRLFERGTMSAPMSEIEYYNEGA